MRSSSPVSRAEEAASSCNACFLPLTRKAGSTASGLKNSSKGIRSDRVKSGTEATRFQEQANRGPTIRYGRARLVEERRSICFWRPYTIGARQAPTTAWLDLLGSELKLNVAV